jgi:hypothetical protein
MPASSAKIVYYPSCRLKCICVLLIVSANVEGGRRVPCCIKPVSLTHLQCSNHDDDTAAAAAKVQQALLNSDESCPK